MQAPKPAGFCYSHGVQALKPTEFCYLHSVQALKPTEFCYSHGVQAPKPAGFCYSHGVQAPKPAGFYYPHGVQAPKGARGAGQVCRRHRITHPSLLLAQRTKTKESPPEGIRRGFVSSFPRGEGLSLPVVLRSCLQLVVIHAELTGHNGTEGLQAAVVKVLLTRFGLLRAVFVDDCLGGEVYARDLARPFTSLFTYLSIPADELEAAVLEAEFEVLLILETLFAGQEEVDAEHIVVLLIFRPINA